MQHYQRSKSWQLLAHLEENSPTIPHIPPEPPQPPTEPPSEMSAEQSLNWSSHDLTSSNLPDPYQPQLRHTPQNELAPLEKS